MNHSKLYVPDPNLWIDFFKHKTHKKVINQTGGSKVISTKSRIKPMNVELVSPVEAADERTESVIKRLKKKSSPIRRRRKRINRKKRSHFVRKKRTPQTKRKKTAKKRKHKGSRKGLSANRRDIFSRL